jgi:type II secretory pathway component PulM
MSTQFATFTNYWKQRAPRERAILATGAGVLVVALVYSTVYAPIAAERARLSKSLPELRSDAARFSRDIAAVKGTGGGGATADLSMLAEAAGLPATALKAAADGKHATLHGKGANWNSIVQLLSDVRRQGWTLAELSVHSADGSATVDVDGAWSK